MIKVEKIKNGEIALEVHGSVDTLAMELATILVNLEKKNSVIVDLANFCKKNFECEITETTKRAEDTKSQLSLDDVGLRKALERLKERFGELHEAE